MLALLLAVQTAVGCASAAECRARAEAAAARGDYEIFHDLAWGAVQKGRTNDPELMYLLARAQSLSGRPGDALVMLGRLAELGVGIDPATSEDFARVRRLAGWPELAARLAGAPPSTAEAAPLAPGAPLSPGAPLAPRARDAPPAPSDAIPFDAADLDPVALAHDAVSRRFVLADRRARRLVVIDEVSHHVVPFVSAESSGFLDELTGFAIDGRRGDLWVVSAKGDGAASVLHKLQLVSGRVLQDVQPPAGAGPVRLVGVTVAPDGTVFALDGAGSRVYRLRPGGRALDLLVRLDAREPTALTSADDRVLYVASAGGVVRVDVASRAASSVKAAASTVKTAGDLAAFASLAWRGGALVGVQRAASGDLVVRVALDASGARERSRTVLASSAHAIVGTLASGAYYYLADQAIRRVRLR